MYLVYNDRLYRGGGGGERNVYKIILSLSCLVTLIAFVFYTNMNIFSRIFKKRENRVTKSNAVCVNVGGGGRENDGSFFFFENLVVLV